MAVIPLEVVVVLLLEGEVEWVTMLPWAALQFAPWKAPQFLAVAAVVLVLVLVLVLVVGRVAVLRVLQVLAASP